VLGQGQRAAMITKVHGETTTGKQLER